jgi:hypothetical protein
MCERDIPVIELLVSSPKPILGPFRKKIGDYLGRVILGQVD